MADNNRSATLNIGGKDFELVLSTQATKEIAARYGGLEKLGEKLSKNENFEQSLDEIIWLITLLANQGILRHNLLCPNDKQELLTEEMIAILTSPYDLADCNAAIMSSMQRGAKREVESENDGKNTQDG